MAQLLSATCHSKQTGLKTVSSPWSKGNKHIQHRVQSVKIQASKTKRSKSSFNQCKSEFFGRVAYSEGLLRKSGKKQVRFSVARASFSDGKFGRRPNASGRRTRGREQGPIVLLQSALYSKQVITRTSGRKLGVVSQLWVDSVKWDVVALSVKPSLIYGEEETILLSSLRQVGDVLLVHDESAVEDNFSLFGYYNIVGSEVVTENGMYLGKVRDFKFNPDSGAVATLIFDGLGLPLIPDTVVSTYAMGVAEVLSAGPDRIIVREKTPSRLRRLSMGILEKLSLSEPPWKQEDVLYSTYSEGRPPSYQNGLDGRSGRRSPSLDNEDPRAAGYDRRPPAYESRGPAYEEARRAGANPSRRQDERIAYEEEIRGPRMRPASPSGRPIAYPGNDKRLEYEGRRARPSSAYGPPVESTSDFEVRERYDPREKSSTQGLSSRPREDGPSRRSQNAASQNAEKGAVWSEAVQRQPVSREVEPALEPAIAERELATRMSPANGEGPPFRERAPSMGAAYLRSVGEVGQSERRRASSSLRRSGIIDRSESEVARLQQWESKENQRDEPLRARETGDVGPSERRRASSNVSSRGVEGNDVTLVQQQRTADSERNEPSRARVMEESSARRPSLRDASKAGLPTRDFAQEDEVTRATIREFQEMARKRAAETEETRRYLRRSYGEDVQEARDRLKTAATRAAEDPERNRYLRRYYGEDLGELMSQQDTSPSKRVAGGTSDSLSVPSTRGRSNPADLPSRTSERRKEAVVRSSEGDEGLAGQSPDRSRSNKGEEDLEGGVRSNGRRGFASQFEPSDRTGNQRTGPGLRGRELGRPMEDSAPLDLRGLQRTLPEDSLP